MPAVGSTVAEMLLDRIRRTPDRPAMRHKEDGVWQVITWSRAGDEATAVAAGLLSLGVVKGQTVNILSGNRPEWHLADWGSMLAGAVPVPIYATNSPDQVAYIVGHSEASIVFVENADQLRKLQKVVDRLPRLARIVLISGVPDEIDERIVTWSDLAAAGRALLDSDPGVVELRARNVCAEDLATIVYTSGTTGLPKGSMITHANAAWTLNAVSRAVGLSDQGERTVSYLPLAHIFERLVSDWGSIYYGMDVWFAESIEKLAENLREIRPTFMIGVPRVFEKFYTKVNEAIAVHPKRHLIERAVEAGRKVAAFQQDGRAIPLGLRAAHGLMDRLVLRKLRRQMGLDQAHLVVSGAAPINPAIIWFIRSLGVNLVEGYGQTEVTAPTSMTPPDRPRIGTVGPPLPGVDVKIAADGEILVRGGNVFNGYLKDDAATRATFTDDGYLLTGDVGRFDEAGYLMITDRKKDLIITAGGKNIAPQVIEEQLKFSPLVSQAVLIGDRRPYLAALLTPDVEGVTAWARAHGVAATDVEAIVADPMFQGEIDRFVADVNSRLSNVEQVKRWTMLDHDFGLEEGEITPTLKARRATIVERYADEIEGLYERRAES
jgi:long-chain acyl-CoA synthetase